MNEDLIADLKQFITAAITQQTSDLREDISGVQHNVAGLQHDVSDIRRDIRTLDAKLDTLSASVAEALEASNASTDEQLKDHEHRLRRLETAA